MTCSTAETFDVGDLVRCTGTFREVNNALIDPDEVFFKFRNPNGLVTTYTYGTDTQLKRDSVGLFHVDLNASIAGTWYYRFYSTGAAQAADEESFEVAPSVFS